MPMVTTRITDAVPITMPSAVSAKRVLLARKLSMASFRTSLISMPSRALNSVSSKPRMASLSGDRIHGFLLNEMRERASSLPQSRLEKKCRGRLRCPS